MKKNETFLQRGGFTIVELLTVMAVIGILIGLLVPALTLVTDHAREIQQRVQFHGIEVGLELFSEAFGGYPESNDNFAAPQHSDDPTPYCGANKLAEAMVGLDYLGFHGSSEWRASGQANVRLTDGNIGANQLVYSAYADVNLWQTAVENVEFRGGGAGSPFVELENANAFSMADVYGDTNIGGFRAGDPTQADDPSTLVLCDVYAKKRTSAVKAGTPILYFRARDAYKIQDSTDAQTIEDDIYYYKDNESLLTLGMVGEPTVDHPWSDEGGSTAAADLLDFEDGILNRQVTTIKRPYNAASFILVSAGKDGLFGNADDIYNFDKKE